MKVTDLAVPLGDGIRVQAQKLSHPNGRGPVLVFLHESLGNIALWKNFPRRVAEASGLDALVYERQGYGASSDEPLPRPYDYLEREGSVYLPRLLDALEIREVILVGHSDGGSIALIAAAALGARAKGLITMAAHTWADHLTLKGIRDMRRRYSEDGIREKLLRHHGDRTDALFHAWQDIWLDEGFHQSLDFTSWLDDIRCPAMIIQGEDDEYGVPEQVTRIVDGIGSQATPVFMPETGHSPHLQQPDRVLQLIVDFVRIDIDQKSAI
ncbi:alpha/beta hydrolase [Marinobacter sp. HL-58]|uniref:alpha/beta fold hydrolase n=1 Tax=Marinobacter sp. HL-58 TaxID=1479237 RepID=UPI00048159A0|nr:alpha/beta hydrolase [Marinobacter sp. HL-58]KPQ00256.1 MAG: putative hydrolases or acyltransferases (alpha/beta hydrolase superfamily) [Marinobacter sp. HL-58]